jgi:PEP-CTERM motif
MKNHIQSSCLAALILAAGLFATTFRASGMMNQILIDESNPSAVVITGSGSISSGTDGSTTANYGIDLVNFFTAAVSVGAQSASSNPSLQPATGGNIYNYYNSDTNHATGAAFLDLNLYSSGTAVQTFTSGNAAFNTGTEVVNLSAYAAYLPALNSNGSIYSGDSSGPGNGSVIGSWRVTTVPEPSTLALAGLGGLGLLLFWRRKS